MLRDNIKENYLIKDFNCAETTLRIINEQYGLDLSDEDIKLVSGFGAGFGCGHTCGVLCAGVAALGRLLVDQRAHNTRDFGPMCAGYVEAFKERFGDTMCSEIVKTYKKPDVRCLETVELGADLFEAYYAKLIAQKEEA